MVAQACVVEDGLEPKGRPGNQGGAGSTGGQGGAEYHQSRAEDHHSREDRGEDSHGKTDYHHSKADGTKDPHGGNDRAEEHCSGAYETDDLERVREWAPLPRE